MSLDALQYQSPKRLVIKGSTLNITFHREEIQHDQQGF